MASDRQQFNRAMQKWEMLHESNLYSAPKSDGHTVVAYSTYSVEVAEEEIKNEINVFAAEALDYVSRYREYGHNASLMEGVERQEFKEVIKNPDVSGVIVIGHGDLSSIYDDNGDKIDWRDIAKWTTHLKRGHFVQRTCGNTLRDLSVPLGTFALANHRRLFAPVGVSFCPEDYPEEEERMCQASNYKKLSYNLIKELFPAKDRDKISLS